MLDILVFLYITGFHRVSAWPQPSIWFCRTTDGRIEIWILNIYINGIYSHA